MLRVRFSGIAATDEQGLNGDYAVKANGAIDVFYVGEVRVAGLTTDEVQETLVYQLEYQGFYSKGRITATADVATFAKKEIVVTGEVRYPGIIQVTSDGTVSQAIAATGGFTSGAGHLVEIIRSSGAGVPDEVITVTRTQVKAGLDLPLRGGDRVRVTVQGDFPNAIQQTFVVLGEVAESGSQTWSAGMTVEKALTLAGGQTEDFSLARSQIRRGVKDAEGRIIKYVVIKNLKLDTVIQPDDEFTAGRRWK